MKPQISEFSYGFALTNELIGWVPLSAAPIFPSLIEEGRAGGGYDVKLDSPAVPVFIQFKRSHCMTRRSAREYKAVVASGDRLDVPYYRFSLMETSLSDQHEMLLELDDGTNLVYYAAPKFHRLAEINHAWSANEIAMRSVFVAPSAIGPVDDEPHAVAFDNRHTWLCSDPKEISGLGGAGLLDELKKAVEREENTLRLRLESLVGDLRQAEARGRERASERRRLGAEKRLDERMQRFDEGKPSTTLLSEVIEDHDESIRELDQEPLEARDPKRLDDNEATLREAADLAARVFDAQLIFVQPAD